MNRYQLHQSFTTMLITLLYMLHTRKCWCSVFREKFLFTSQSFFLQTLPLIWRLQLWDGVCYQTKHLILNFWVKIFYFILISHQRGSFKISIGCPWHSNCISHNLHTYNCPHMWEDSDIRLQEHYKWQLTFHYRIHFLIRITCWCEE
jgi:hypothetical protein